MELINGRTAEEIKRGMHACNGLRCDLECPYSEIEYGCIGTMVRDALALIERLEATQLRWISVEERLPEKIEAVNIVWVNRQPVSYYAHIKDKPFTGTGYYHNGKWWWYSSTCEDYLKEYGWNEFDLVDECIEITHWMQLPEPPKESA